jgi:hypothetical protein
MRGAADSVQLPASSCRLSAAGFQLRLSAGSFQIDVTDLTLMAGSRKLLAVGW